MYEFSKYYLSEFAILDNAISASKEFTPYCFGEQQIEINDDKKIQTLGDDIN